MLISLHSFEKLSTHFSIGIIYSSKFMRTFTCHSHDNTKDPGSLVKLELYFWSNPCQGKISCKYVNSYQKSTEINWQLFIIETSVSRQPSKYSGKAFTKWNPFHSKQKPLGKLNDEVDLSKGYHRSIIPHNSFPWFGSPVVLLQKWWQLQPFPILIRQRFQQCYLSQTINFDVMRLNNTTENMAAVLKEESLVRKP